MKKLKIIFLIFFISAAVFACTSSNQDETSPNTAVSVESQTGSIKNLLESMNMYYFEDPVKAPGFELSSVDGKLINLDQYRGNVILLSFWATW
ncbi:MAG: hypothetical protein ABFR82_03640 [Nitrospirota bacterium]